MRRRDDIGMLQESEARCRRFVFEHVETGTGDAPLPQGSKKRGLINHTAAPVLMTTAPSGSVERSSASTSPRVAGVKGT